MKSKLMSVLVPPNRVIQDAPQYCWTLNSQPNPSQARIGLGPQKSQKARPVNKLSQGPTCSPFYHPLFVIVASDIYRCNSGTIAYTNITKNAGNQAFQATSRLLLGARTTAVRHVARTAFRDIRLLPLTASFRRSQQRTSSASAATAPSATAA
jgi:hypothetical protein